MSLIAAARRYRDVLKTPMHSAKASRDAADAARIELIAEIDRFDDEATWADSYTECADIAEFAELADPLREAEVEKLRIACQAESDAAHADEAAVAGANDPDSLRMREQAKCDRMTMNRFVIWCDRRLAVFRKQREKAEHEARQREFSRVFEDVVKERFGATALKEALTEAAARSRGER